MAPNWKQHRRFSVGGCLKELLYIHTMDYYSVIKKHELLIHITRMNLQRIIPSEEKRQSKKIVFHMIPLRSCSWNDKIIKTENKLVVARGGGKKEVGVTTHVMLGMFYIIIASVLISWLLHCTTALQDITMKGNWEKYTLGLSIISSNCMWICNYLQINRLIYF